MENGNVEYFDFFHTRWYDLSFQAIGNVLFVKGITQGQTAETHLFEISFKDGHIVLTHQGHPEETLDYWGASAQS